MTREAREAKVQHVGLLDGFSTKQSAVRKADAAPSRHVLDIKEQDACNLVHEQEADGGDVEEQKQEQGGNDGHPNARLRDV